MRNTPSRKASARSMSYASSTFSVPAGEPVAIDVARLSQCLPNEPDLSDAGELTLVPTIHFTRMDGHWWRLFLNEDRVTARHTGRELWLRDDTTSAEANDDETVPSTALCVGIAGEE
jgi:hypothetical protein